MHDDICFFLFGINRICLCPSYWDQGLSYWKDIKVSQKGFRKRPSMKQLLCLRHTTCSILAAAPCWRKLKHSKDKGLTKSYSGIGAHEEHKDLYFCCLTPNPHFPHYIILNFSHVSVEQRLERSQSENIIKSRCRKAVISVMAFESHCEEHFAPSFLCHTDRIA